MNNGAFITVNNIVKRYKKRTALDHVSFDIGKGEIFGLIGPNGAGKSTFISLLATISKPDSGDICIDGRSIIKHPGDFRGRIGYVPQEVALYPMLTANENLDFWAGIYGIEGQQKHHRIKTALEYLKLADRANDKVKTFSGGMKRRLNIAASLLHRPEILIMDEPTAGVDVLSRNTIAEMMKDLQRASCTLIITSHYIDELELLCNRMAILNKGKLLYTGTLNEVLKKAGADSLQTLMLGLEEA